MTDYSNLFYQLKIVHDLSVGNNKDNELLFENRGLNFANYAILHSSISVHTNI